MSILHLLKICFHYPIILLLFRFLLLHKKIYGI
nr:MAG TPA: hypothetical protein [Bacteriophage sp.]